MTSYSGLVTRLRAAYSDVSGDANLNGGIYNGEVISSYRETSLEQIQNYFAAASFYLSGIRKEPGYRWGSGPSGAEEDAKRASLPSHMRAAAFDPTNGMEQAAVSVLKAIKPGWQKGAESQSLEKSKCKVVLLQHQVYLYVV